MPSRSRPSAAGGILFFWGRYVRAGLGGVTVYVQAVLLLLRCCPCGLPWFSLIGHWGRGPTKLIYYNVVIMKQGHAASSMLVQSRFTVIQHFSRKQGWE